MKTRKICVGIAILAVLCMATGGRDAAAAVVPEPGGPAMGAGLAFGGTPVKDPSGNPVYKPADNIAMILSVSNAGDGEVITARGWADTPFHLYLEFTGPDGKIITSPMIADTLVGHPQDPGAADVHVPPPLQIEVNGTYVQVEKVEVLAGSTPGPGFTKTTSIPSAGYYYPLTAVGRYAVRAVIPMASFAAYYFQDGEYYAPIGENAPGKWEGAIVSPPLYFTISDDHDGDTYYSPVDPVSPGRAADCDDNNPLIYPGAPVPPSPLPGVDYNCDGQVLSPEILGNAPAIINVLAETQKVGSGTYTSSTREPIAGMPVKVIGMAPGSCAAAYGVTWDKYGLIYANCPGVSGVTNSAGNVTFTVPAGDYVVIGPYLRIDNTYMADTAAGVVSGKTYGKFLQLIVTGSLKHVPGKYTKRTGSELLIIEPAYVEWNGVAEQYPFILRGVGDWAVVTAIQPPAGFVADYPQLNAVVSSDTKALQFTVTDVGSDWVDTKVEHQIKHKGRTEKIKTRIGVKKGKGAKP